MIFYELDTSHNVQNPVQNWSNCMIQPSLCMDEITGRQTNILRRGGYAHEVSYLHQVSSISMIQLCICDSAQVSTKFSNEALKILGFLDEKLP